MVSGYFRVCARAHLPRDALAGGERVEHGAHGRAGARAVQAAADLVAAARAVHALRAVLHRVPARLRAKGVSARDQLQVRSPCKDSTRCWIVRERAACIGGRGSHSCASDTRQCDDSEPQATGSADRGRVGVGT